MCDVKIDQTGFRSRAVIINDGELVIKFPKGRAHKYEYEAQIVRFLGSQNLNVNLQRVRNCGKNFIVFDGIIGKTLNCDNDFDTKKRAELGEKLAHFLIKLHTLTPENVCFTPIKSEFQAWKTRFFDNEKHFKKHFSAHEIEQIREILTEKIPQKLLSLGVEMRFCHSDINLSNIFFDEKIGVIDFEDAGFYEIANDFSSIDDDVILRALISEYCLKTKTDAAVLFQKAELRRIVRQIISPQIFKNNVQNIREIINNQRLFEISQKQ